MYRVKLEVVDCPALAIDVKSCISHIFLREDTETVWTFRECIHALDTDSNCTRRFVGYCELVCQIVQDESRL